MDFTFLSPAAFSLLLALPLLFLPYLLQQRHTQLVVPALFLYQDISAPARRRLWGRLRLTPLFFLQLLILLLLVGIAARPVVQQETVQKIAMVMDTSASMQARTDSGTRTLSEARTLFDMAKTQLAQELSSVSAESLVSVFTTNPLGTNPLRTRPLGTTLAESTLPLSGIPNMPSIQNILQQLAVSDAPDPSDTALSVFFNQLLNERGFERVLFFTDRSLAPVADFQQSGDFQIDAQTLRVVTLGTPRPNLAITDFRLYRSPFYPDEIQATVRVDAGETQAAWQIVIEDGQTNQRLMAQQVNQTAQQTFSFSHLPVTHTYRARIVIDPKEDGLDLDNTAYAVLPTLTDVQVLLVTPTPEIGESLRHIPNLELTLQTPEAYDPEQVSQFGFILFHLTAPDVLPPTPAAFLLPPDGNRLFSLGQAAAQPRITNWSLGHPLTAYLSFSLLRPAYAQALQPLVWCPSIIHSTAGPLVLAGERTGNRYVATGFDILPYLGQKNLPVSILTLNILGWLADRAGRPGHYTTGDVVAPQPNSNGANGEYRSTLQIRFPHETAFQLLKSAVPLNQQGVYTFRENGTERRVAVNLFSPKEARLGKPLSLSQEALEALEVFSIPSEAATRTVDQPLWPWLLLAVLGLCGLEWWFSARAVEPVPSG